MEETQKEYPIIILENPTPFQYDVFMQTVPYFQNYRLFKTNFDDYKDFKKYSRIERVEQDGNEYFIYKTNDYRVYYSMARVSYQIISKLYQIAKSNKAINKIYQDNKDRLRELDNINLCWVDVNGNKMPLDIQAFCTLAHPTAKEVRDFNAAVMNNLDNLKIFTLVSVSNGTDINYYLKRESLTGQSDIEFINNIRKSALGAGLSVLRNKTKADFIFYDEIGNKNAAPEVWARKAVRYATLKRRRPELVTLTEHLENIKSISSTLESIDGFRPVAIFESIRVPSEHIVSNLMKNFLMVSKFQDYSPIVMENLQFKIIEEEDINYVVCYARGNLLQNFIVQRSLNLFKTIKRDNHSFSGYTPYVIGATGLIYPAQYFPVCSFQKENFLPEDTKSVLNIVSVCQTNTLDFDILDISGTPTLFVRIAPESTSRISNIREIKEIKSKALVQLRKNKIKPQILDDNGFPIDKYNPSEVKSSLFRKTPEFSTSGE